MFAIVEYLKHAVSSEHYGEKIQYDISGDKNPEKSFG